MIVGIFLGNKLRENLEPLLAEAWEVIDDLEVFGVAKGFLDRMAKMYQSTSCLSVFDYSRHFTLNGLI